MDKQPAHGYDLVGLGLLLFFLIVWAPIGMHIHPEVRHRAAIALFDRPEPFVISLDVPV